MGKPPQDLDLFLEKWLRDNDKMFHVRLLHQTLFLGSKKVMPSLRQIELLMNDNERNIRSLEEYKPKKKKKKRSKKKNKFEFEPRQRKQSVKPPPKLTSAHE